MLAPGAPQRSNLAAWLDQSEPSIKAVVIARNAIAAAAAQRDVTATGAACQSATGTVANLQQQLPGPAPMLNSMLQRATDSYRAGLPHCASAVENRDAAALSVAANYIAQGDEAMRAALDILHQQRPESRDPIVLIV